MPSDLSPASVQDIRRLVIVQLAVTIVFLTVVFWMFDGTNGDYPPVWVPVVLLTLVVVGVLLSERVWLSGTPLDPAEAPEVNRRLGLEAYAEQTVRRLIYSEAPLLLGVLMCFVGDWGGWPVLIVALPGLAAQAWETWPHLRSTSLSAAIFDSLGADSQLIEGFRDK